MHRETWVLEVGKYRKEKESLRIDLGHNITPFLRWNVPITLIDRKKIKEIEAKEVKCP